MCPWSIERQQPSESLILEIEALTPDVDEISNEIMLGHNITVDDCWVGYFDGALGIIY